MVETQRQTFGTFSDHERAAASFHRARHLEIRHQVVQCTNEVRRQACRRHRPMRNCCRVAWRRATLRRTVISPATQYRRAFMNVGRDVVERVTGIEPAFSAWEADVLPLNYTRRTSPQDTGDRTSRIKEKTCRDSAENLGLCLPGTTWDSSAQRDRRDCPNLAPPMRATSRSRHRRCTNHRICRHRLCVHR